MSVARSNWSTESSTECPYDEGTETQGSRHEGPGHPRVPPSAPMTRGLKRRSHRRGQGRTLCSTECPYDEGTETMIRVPHVRGQCWRSTECPYDEGTETFRTRDRRHRSAAVPPSAPMTRGLKHDNLRASPCQLSMSSTECPYDEG